eukprot:5866456-Amphidinium_carterae.1
MAAEAMPCHPVVLTHRTAIVPLKPPRQKPCICLGTRIHTTLRDCAVPRPTSSRCVQMSGARIQDMRHRTELEFDG